MKDKLLFISRRILAVKEYLTDKEAMLVLGDQIWDILQESYGYIGGYQGAANIRDLVGKSYLWKIVYHENQPLAFGAYKSQNGLKRIASARNLSYPNKQKTKSAIRSLYKEDFRRAWSEVSEKAEEALIRLGGGNYKVPFDKVVTLFPDKELKPTEDSYHYQRQIGGSWKTKIVIGSPRYQGLLQEHPQTSSKAL